MFEEFSASSSLFTGSVPSSYAVYQFYTFPDHDTPVQQSTISPEFNDTRIYRVVEDQQIMQYLKQQVYLHTYIYCIVTCITLENILHYYENVSVFIQICDLHTMYIILKCIFLFLFIFQDLMMFIFDDDDPDDSNYVGVAKVPLFRLANGEKIKGTYPLYSVSKFTIAKSNFWYPYKFLVIQ